MKKIAMLLFLGLIVFSCSSRKVTARKSTPIKHKTERIVKTEKQAELEVEAANAETPSFNTLIVKSTAEYLALFGAIDCPRRNAPVWYSSKYHFGTRYIGIKFG